MSPKTHWSQDEQNTTLVDSVTQVEELVSSFYNQYPYPWRPYAFHFVEDGDFSTRLLSQELGSWSEPLLPLQGGTIWVAGCGTNQAIEIALRFPQASVIGSDLSESSLELARTTAEELGIKNLILRKESINAATYEACFDYVICTGVIISNADPALTLEKLARAVKSTGIIELMVYNRYHRIVTSAFQQAIRLINPSDGQPDFAQDLLTAKQILKTPHMSEWIVQAIGNVAHQQEVALADALIHPVEYSYTVRSLEMLVESCGLRIPAPCINIFDKARGTYNWDLQFGEDALQNRYESLPDTQRWYVTNLIGFEKSPMLWFYIQRKDAPDPIPPAKELVEGFLETTFRKNEALQQMFVMGQDKHYHLSPRSVPLPNGSPHKSLHEVIKLVDGKQTMREIFTYLNMPLTFENVNIARIRLTTPMFPYLVTV